MKKSLLLLAFILFISTETFSQSYQEVISLGYFDSIVNVHEVNNSTILIISNGGTYHATLYNFKEGKVKDQIIRNGRGPSELQKVEASTIDTESDFKYLYLKGIGGKIIKYNLDKGELEIQRVSSMAGISYLEVFKDELVLSKKVLIPPKLLEEQDSLIVGYVLDKNTLDLKKQIKISTLDLGLSGIEQSNRLDNLQVFNLDTFLSKITNELYLLATKGVNNLKVLSNTELIKTIDLKEELPYEIEVLNHSQFGYGIKTPGIINNVVKTAEGIYSYSFGQPGGEIDSGYLTISNVLGETQVQKENVPESRKLIFDVSIKDINCNLFLFGKSMSHTTELYMFN
jgi:WD40 repeat protein